MGASAPGAPSAVGDAVTDIRRRIGDDQSKWQWGRVHTADFRHPLADAPGVGDLFEVEPVQRGGDNFTVMLSGGVSANNTKQNSGASIMFVHDVQDWDRSVALNTPTAIPTHSSLACRGPSAKSGVSGTVSPAAMK